MTFDTWHSAIFFDWVQGIMLASQGKVLSPGNEGSMAVIVYVSIFPKRFFICVHMPISGLPFWCNSCTCPKPVSPCAPRGDRRTERKPTVWIGFGLYLGVGYCKGFV